MDHTECNGKVILIHENIFSYKEGAKENVEFLSNKLLIKSCEISRFPLSLKQSSFLIKHVEFSK